MRIAIADAGTHIQLIHMIMVVDMLPVPHRFTAAARTARQNEPNQSEQALPATVLFTHHSSDITAGPEPLHYTA